MQSYATTENSNTNTQNIYPWDVNNAKAPYVRSIFIDAGASPQIPSEHDTAHSPYPVAFFQGATSTKITADQATLLTNYTAYGTGYADCIVTS